jgi:hypothetical protein
MEYAGYEWIERSMGKTLSPLGKNVADLLGEVFLGIYHLDHNALSHVEWDDKDVIVYTLSYHPLCTVDSDELTKLVIRAHDRMLRLSLKSVAPNRIQLMFHQRNREGDLYHRCPAMEEHLANIREHYGEPETVRA